MSLQAEPKPAYPGLSGTSFLSLLGLSFGAHAIFLALALGFLCIQVLLGHAYPGMTVAPLRTVLLVSPSTILVLLLTLVCYEFMRMAIWQKPKRPALQLVRNIRDLFRNRPLIASGLPAFLCLQVTVYAFANVKANIPAINPFSWDSTFDHWDKVLHFGLRPWEWLHPVMGHWPVTFLINVNYNLWFFLMYGVWLRFAFFEAPGERRTRFLLAFMMTWMIGGGLLAIVFSSAGPCFYGAGRLGLSPDPAHPVPFWAVRFQDMLWDWHLQGMVEASISAMPSLHNAMSLLFALASRGWPGWLRWLLWANVVLIFLGSVHLAWHYAVDAYVAWALTVALWWAAAPLARRWEALPPARRYREAHGRA